MDKILSTRSASRTSEEKYRQKTFDLNLDKAISKKILAARREVHFAYEQTKGGLVGTVDAVTFELIKNAIPHYYENIMPDNRYAKTTDDQDRRGLTVNKVDLKRLNEKLEEELHKLTNQLTQDLTPQDNNTSHRPLNYNDEAQCSKCNRNVQSRAIYCDKGHHWVHYRCIKLSDAEIEAAEKLNDNEYYTCKLCISDPHATTQSLNSMKAIKNAFIDSTYSSTQSIKSHNCQNGLQALLDEELHAVCNICNKIIDAQVVRCSSCTQPCHISCTSYDGHEYICSSCEIDIDISKESNNSRIETLEKISNTQIKEPYPCSVNPTKTVAQDNSSNSSSMKTIVEESLEITSLSSIVQNANRTYPCHR
ncbi:Hypothetical predicted protein [Mytilus galloprovincialis]|uniref:Zinc finger PHD-type domain-containing protein n=1 Tax=Mytilus galloprovincialis TaxID=29158 RepID=A0A8B6GJR0_MYTGA|nr:Hypothetical predicted protein [Mytilus galloprovincialis]